ncbi:hypothetical protein A3D62_01875 [Candidatus Kaiserbacteria bacterium RIFCSPHIGHO2_02_FULL_49_11]|uniref:Uncharacterized protein n=1 Tax=Candidatus Kaiserbacteria bacterium RIFCSPHIGHO2_02_FULL_49_11 TaxID=1798489 RepID=A0A1F6D1A8_9BACT|nr:MAG: hypothetical protein A3D62_01875 [Candidatus Kaiserbacteria bacterium RIFCSPHIGHO2_02_FULL_49_11]
MEVFANKRRFFQIVDALMERKRLKLYPFNTKQAYVPQLLILPEIRRDTVLLACYYFCICIYMRGGVESHTVFKQFNKMWQKHPEMFLPEKVAGLSHEYIHAVLKRFIGWDAVAAARFWKANMTALYRNWGGNPFNILRGISSYEEACRRLRNKNGRSGTKKLLSLDPVEEGFIGFQFKMVSMFLYFCDWEGWLRPRFLYPSPADFHHYRLFIANEAVVIKTHNGRSIRYDEKISNPIRTLLMKYLKERRADPVEVADALWLFSLLMCGESPVTKTRSAEMKNLSLFKTNLLDGLSTSTGIASAKKRQLLQTCGACILEKTCKFAIPSHPYYRRGILELRNRPPIGLATFKKTPSATPPKAETDPSKDQFGLTFSKPDE